MENFSSVSKYGMIKRIKDLHEIILSGSYPDIKTLCEKLERSAATIYRDLRFLKKDLQAPLKFDPVKKGYFYIEKYDFNFDGVSENEAEKVMQKMMQQKLKAIHPRYYGELSAFLDYLNAKEK